MDLHEPGGAKSSKSLIPQMILHVCKHESFSRCIYQYSDTYKKIRLNRYMCSKTYVQMDFFIYVRICAPHSIQVSCPQTLLFQSPQQYVSPCVQTLVLFATDF